MAKAKTRRKGRKGGTAQARPRWSILPPEIIRMILQYLVDSKETIRACSRAAREFRHVALSFLGRHLTINDVDRLEECTRMTRKGAFQHIRSLDLGVDNKNSILEEYWKSYIAILGAFAQYRTLNRLWLSEVPFIFLKQSQKKKVREAITTLGCTTTELGLYGCHFSSYEEMISFIRSFPVCIFLFVRGCVTGEQVTGGNAFAGLPEHRLAVKDLQLSASSSNDLLIDISNLIEDAALDVKSLTSLLCDVGTSERTKRVAAAVSSSPVEQLQVASSQPGGFQAFIDRFSKWPLKSLSIGPQIHETNAEFWAEAFKDLPQLPRVDNVTILYHYPKPTAFNTYCWEYFNRTLTRTDLFPALQSVYIRTSCGSYRLTSRKWISVFDSLRAIRMRGIGPYLYYQR